MTSNLVSERHSSSSISYPNLVILAQTVFNRSRCRDDDGDDDDGVRGLCHKRLRQLRWARALKILFKRSNDLQNVPYTNLWSAYYLFTICDQIAITAADWRDCMNVTSNKHNITVTRLDRITYTDYLFTGLLTDWRMKKSLNKLMSL